VANLLKAVKVYLSPLEKDPRKIEAWRTRVSEFMTTGEIERWQTDWQLAWRKRRRYGAIAKDGEDEL
jgi:hypothetical protein